MHALCSKAVHSGAANSDLSDKSLRADGAFMLTPRCVRTLLEEVHDLAGDLRHEAVDGEQTRGH